MLKVENISTGYGKKQVLFDVSFDVKQGEIVLLIGGNGSGKSTLLKTIYGLVPLWKSLTTNSYGNVEFESEKITGKPTSTLLKKGLLYVPQKSNLFEDLTVKENLEIAGLLLADKKELKERIDYALVIFPLLVPYLSRIPMKLSGGERQMLILAMAILHKPKLLLLDEPGIGLSQRNLNMMFERVSALNQEGITFLIVEHRIKESYSIADKIIGLKLGKVFIETEVSPKLEMQYLHSIFI